MRIKFLTRETLQGDSTVFDLVPSLQVRPQAFFCMRLHLFQYLAGVAIMEVVRPPAKGGVHAPNNIIQRYRGAFPSGQLRYTFFDFRKRFWCRADMRVALTRPPTLAHPDGELGSKKWTPSLE